ncbi:MAG: 30S ribosome-binding factor RbfA [Minwuia sp.]|uniref:30S ribosome-binding factor RbfA n=1 Tax=Minwuia sp. TaxID=2493630 RepID=UPI003A8A80BF
MGVSMRHHRKKTDGPGTRQLRVGELVRHAIVEILRREEIQDPSVAGRSITVTEVSLSPDLRNATVFVEPLGGRDVEEVLAGLNRSSRFVAGRVAKSVKLKYAPTLAFRRDHSFDHAQHIDGILRSGAVKPDLDDGAS